MSEPDQYLTETGMLANAADALIDPQKLLGYSLDPDHSPGWGQGAGFGAGSRVQPNQCRRTRGRDSNRDSLHAGSISRSFRTRCSVQR